MYVTMRAGSMVKVKLFFVNFWTKRCRLIIKVFFIFKPKEYWGQYDLVDFVEISDRLANGNDNSDVFDTNGGSYMGR